MIIYVVIAVVVVFGLSRLVAEIYAFSLIYSVDNSPKARVAVVFGAGLNRDGTPTTVLRDRVDTASKLYFSGKVEKILMSGDNRFLYYNEPGAMYAYAIELGVPKEVIVMDYAGRRTYDTCYRARDIFGLSEVILVTQRFHLPRALLICNALGIKATGVSADIQTYRKSSQMVWYLRETVATLYTYFDIWILKPLPVLGESEPIFPSNPAAATDIPGTDNEPDNSKDPD